jgi:hypothetical protein
MSVEKIKERIKMIENNDFTTNNTMSEDINLNRDEIGKFLDPKNKAAIKAASIGFDKTDKISSAHAELFGKSGVRFSSENKTKVLAQNIQNLINPIFTEMENLNILPDNLISNSFQPKVGYDVSRRGNRLTLADDGEITLQFNNIKLDVINTMYITNVGNFNQNDFNDLYNRLYSNKSRLNIKDVKINGQKVIQIEFK